MVAIVLLAALDFPSFEGHRARRSPPERIAAEIGPEAGHIAGRWLAIVRHAPLALRGHPVRAIT